jgi:hypothetical protein
VSGVSLSQGKVFSLVSELTDRKIYGRLNNGFEARLFITLSRLMSNPNIKLNLSNLSEIFLVIFSSGH